MEGPDSFVKCSFVIFPESSPSFSRSQKHRWLLDLLHMSLQIKWLESFRDFEISRIGVSSALSSARPTPYSQFPESVRSTVHDISRSNSSDRVMFHDSRILTVVFSDLYSLRVSEMSRSHHVSSLMDGPTISRFRDFVSHLFSCALQRTKPPESDGYRSSALNLTDENLLPFLCAPRPF
jgi:hypothetical protein